MIAFNRNNNTINIFVSTTLASNGSVNIFSSWPKMAGVLGLVMSSLYSFFSWSCCPSYCIVISFMALNILKCESTTNQYYVHQIKKDYEPETMVITLAKQHKFLNPSNIILKINLPLMAKPVSLLHVLIS